MMRMRGGAEEEEEGWEEGGVVTVSLMHVQVDDHDPPDICRET